MSDPENLPLGDALDIARAGFNHAACPDGALDCNAARVLSERYLEEHPGAVARVEAAAFKDGWRNW